MTLILPPRRGGCCHPEAHYLCGACSRTSRIVASVYGAQWCMDCYTLLMYRLEEHKRALVEELRKEGNVRALANLMVFPGA